MTGFFFFLFLILKRLLSQIAFKVTLSNMSYVRKERESKIIEIPMLLSAYIFVLLYILLTA